MKLSVLHLAFSLLTFNCLATTQLYSDSSNVLLFYMYDTFGDGWNGNTYEIIDADGNVVAEGGLLEGSSGVDTLFLIDGCYIVSVGGGLYVQEISWEIPDVVSGSGVGEVVFGVNEWCNELNACTYNDISYTFFEGFVDDCTYCRCESNPDYWCTVGMEPWEYSIWNCEYNIISNDCGEEQLEPVFGCFDPQASNYCDSCNVDDNSCIYNITIEQIQSEMASSSYEDLTVITTGVVVAISDGGFFMQEQFDTQVENLWGGIYIETIDNIPVYRNLVTVRGVVEERDGMTIITDVSSYEVLGQSANVSPIELNQGELMEEHEGCLVEYDYLTCVAQNNEMGEASFENEIGNIIVSDDLIYLHPYQQGAKHIIQGVVIEEDGVYKLCPRNVSDVSELLSISELDQEVVVKVRNQLLNVKSNSNEDSSYELFNILGEKITEGIFNSELNLSIESFSASAYILRVDNAYYRFVKN